MAQVKEKALTKADLQNSKANVDSKTAKDRLWESLDYGYGKEREASNKAYDKTASESARSMIGKGMQRSSYGAQTQANIANEKIKAANDIYDKQVSEYSQGLYQIERDEKSDEFRQQELNNQAAQVGAQYAQIAAQKEIAANELAFKQKQQDWENTYKERDWWQQKTLADASLGLDTRRVGVEEGKLALDTANSVVSNAVAEGHLANETASTNAQVTHLQNSDIIDQGRLANETASTNANVAHLEASDELARDELDERIRSNKANEDLQGRSLDETERHNRAGEELSAEDLALDRDKLNASIDQFEKQFDYNKLSDTQKNALDFSKMLISAGKDVSPELIELIGLPLSASELTSESSSGPVITWRQAADAAAKAAGYTGRNDPRIAEDAKSNNNNNTNNGNTGNVVTAISGYVRNK